MDNKTTIAYILSQLKEKGSWCGETHLQKTVYFIQELAKQDIGYSFVLYKHGPFSFALRDEIRLLIAFGKVELDYPIGSKYGAKLEYKDVVEQLEDGEFRNAIERITKFVGSRGVAELERLSTALLLLKPNQNGKSVQELADELVRLKPHIRREKALEALAIMGEKIAEYESIEA